MVVKDLVTGLNLKLMVLTTVYSNVLKTGPVNLQKIKGQGSKGLTGVKSDTTVK